MRTALLRGLAWFVAAGVVLVATPARAQLGTLASPGPLSRPHAALEGLATCQKCHTPGHEVTAGKCLACHAPIADRIARRTGVHRDVTGACTACHVEHQGTDADLRRFDPRGFNHAVETGFPLEKRHARLPGGCAACHKQRTFLSVRPACSSCHTDVHKGTLGHECTGCHSTAVPFAQARRQFDHSRARFLLTGAHRAVDCQKCHVAGRFRGLQFDTCASCHKTPHRHTLGPTCASCHVTDRWTSRTIDHARTGFVLAGAHARVTCAQCHTAGVTKPLVADRCSSCHANVHRDSLKDDCRTCHSENSFRGAPFDHGMRTAFPLTGRHEGLACRLCHTGILNATDVPLALRVVDFGGASARCAACHKDPHKGEYGRLCDACHRAATFKAGGFVHPRAPEFFAGRHAGVPCARCHVRAAGPDLPRTGATPVAAREPVRATSPAMTCTTCHADVHLGQMGPACDRCHTIDAARFAPARFSHETVGFPLDGKHRTLECAKCHRSETGAFPAGSGTARRFNPTPTECRACHADTHLGQVGSRCATCHSTESFARSTFDHRGLEHLFGVASHRRLPCRSCHKPESGQFPAGRGTAVRLKGLGRTCLECHP